MASVRFHGIYMYISFLDLLVGVIYFAALYSIHWGLLFSVDGDYPTGIWVSLWPAFEVRVIRHRSGINCTYGNPKLTERQPRVAATIVSIFVGFPRVARAFQLQNISPDFRGLQPAVPFTRTAPSLFACSQRYLCICRRWKCVLLQRIFARCISRRYKFEGGFIPVAAALAASSSPKR